MWFVVHTSARSNPRRQARFSLAQKIILGVIAILAIVIIAATIFFVNYDAKAQVEHQFTNLVSQYYEDYFYPNAFGSDQALATNYLSHFTSIGLTPVPLRQLILAAPNLSESDAKFLREHCNENATSVTYYPDEPYTNTSYHTELEYSCDFE